MRLLADEGIIRNRPKINAAIVNAQKIRDLQKEYGSFKGWLDANRKLSKDEWIKLFEETLIHGPCWIDPARMQPQRSTYS